MVRAKKKVKKYFLGMTQEDFSKENLITGGLIRPAILMTSFLTFVGALLLVVFSVKADPITEANYLRWGGSGIIFAFILNLYSIYDSLGDKPSIFKNLNLVFKLSLFFLEVFLMGYVLTYILPNPILF